MDDFSRILEKKLSELLCTRLYYYYGSNKSTGKETGKTHPYNGLPSPPTQHGSFKSDVHYMTNERFFNKFL